MEDKKKETEDKSKLKKWLANIAIFLGKGFALGRWEVKFTWKF